MTQFNERLARMADAARALAGGEEVAHDLLRLAADVDQYLEQQRADWYRKRLDWFQKYNEFLNESVEDARRRGDDALMIERRRIARAVAGDPRWSGGYADALALLEVGGVTR